MAELDVSISDNTTPDENDGEENVSGGSWNDLSYLGLGHTFEVTDSSAGKRMNGGVRFEGITIAAADTITSATLSFEVETLVGTGWDINISLDVAAADAPVWSNSSRPSSGFTASTNSPIATTMSATGTKNVTVTALLQDAIGQGSWASGNAIRFGLFAPTADNYHRSFITDYEPDDNATVATLNIVYTEAGSGVTSRLTLLGAG